MNIKHLSNKYLLPAIIIILLLSFIIYASVNEGFIDNNVYNLLDKKRNEIN
jgi:hypothetical protein